MQHEYTVTIRKDEVIKLFELRQFHPNKSDQDLISMSLEDSLGIHKLSANSSAINKEKPVTSTEVVPFEDEQELGKMYYALGRLDNSIEWYEKAAELNYPKAFIALARNVQIEFEKPETLQEAKSWFEKVIALREQDRSVSRQVCGEAHFELGEMYEYFEHHTNAMDQFEKGAEMRNREAEASLAAYYIVGEFVPQDIEKALKLLRHSNTGYAHQLLGQYYLNCFNTGTFDEKKAKDHFYKMIRVSRNSHRYSFLVCDAGVSAIIEKVMNQG